MVRVIEGFREAFHRNEISEVPLTPGSSDSIKADRISQDPPPQPSSNDDPRKEIRKTGEVFREVRDVSRGCRYPTFD